MTVTITRPVGVEAVGPSLFVKLVIGPMTRVLNPLTVRFAGRKHFKMAARLYHVGRRSGRQYVTPVGARVDEARVVIPLTFGNQSDWCRNVLAAGRCRIRLLGRTYTAVAPELQGRHEALAFRRAAFNPIERSALRVLGIRQFMVLEATPVIDEG